MFTNLILKITHIAYFSIFNSYAMKKTTLLFGMLLAFATTQAQSIERQVIGSAGSTITNGSTTLEFTVGEVAVTTITNGTTTLTQGFHQGDRMIVVLNAKVFLQGPLLGSGDGLMQDGLRSGGHIPTATPYSDGATADASVFNVTGNDAIVDWIYVELRDSGDNTSVVAETSALVQRDGDIVHTDGTSGLSFMVAEGNYYVAIKHRNHLGVITNATQALTETGLSLDLTDNSVTMYSGNGNSDPLTNFGTPNASVYAMWAGDANNDERVIFLNTGAESVDVKQLVLDRSAIESPFGASVFYKPQGYYNEDLYMDGEVIFLNAGNDLILVRDNVLADGGNIFNSVFHIISAQLP